MPGAREPASATPVPQRTAPSSASRPVLRKYSDVIAMITKASIPSRNVTIIVLILYPSWIAGRPAAV